MQVERVLVLTDRYTFVMLWFRDQTKYPWNIIFISLGKRLSTMAENSLVIVLSFLHYPLYSLEGQGVLCLCLDCWSLG